jgi:hypothetical protein
MSEIPAALREYLAWPPVKMFLAAVAGSLSLESLRVVTAYELGRPLSVRYRRWTFWLARLGLACGAGVLAGLSTENGWLAFYMGASFPAFLANVSHNPPDPGQPGAPPAAP